MTVTRRLGNVIIGFAAVSMALAGWTSWENRQESACQARYNAAFALALKERAVIADQDRMALGDMVSGFLTATKPGDALRVLQTYQDTEARLTKARIDTPLPNNHC